MDRNTLKIFIAPFRQLIGIFACLLLVLIFVLALVYLWTNRNYKRSSYYRITHTPYLALRKDVGRFGEYMTYKYLKHYENFGAKFLFNVYIPKQNGQTTEIDILMICRKGIFVFESKNYSGWIFGGEKQKNWCQTLPSGKNRSKKEYFYNPIMQNATHIRHLKTLTGSEIPFFSIIVFSERCTLKSLSLQNDAIKVIKRDKVLRTVSDICKTTPHEALTDYDVNRLYKKLYPYTQLNAAGKKQHVENIKKNLST